MKTLTSLKFATAMIAMTAVGGMWLAPAAHAAKIKDCGTTDVTNPPNGSAGFQETETQIAACNSNSNTGEETETTNKGGGTPGGFNK